MPRRSDATLRAAGKGWRAPRPMRFPRALSTTPIVLFSFGLFRCGDDAIDPPVYPPRGHEYAIAQTISDEAQRNTISFDGLEFLTGNVGSQSFLSPHKVAGYSGFQCLRDDDPTKLGHDTDFVTIIAFNILHILDDEQIDVFVRRATGQIRRCTTHFQQDNKTAYSPLPEIRDTFIRAEIFSTLNRLRCLPS